MAKPPPRRIPSDDFVIESDGAEYRPHQGEWVDVLPGYTVADMQDTARFQKLMDDRTAIGADEPEALSDWMERADVVLASLARGIDARLVAWSWTDARGRALPAPSPEVVASLTWDELGYLLRVVRGQGEQDRPNASAPSPITSSATARPRSLSESGGGRNHTRAS